MKLPRVVQVVLSLDTGGTERLVVDICTRLQRRFEMAVCCLDTPGALARDLADKGIEVVAFHRRSGFRPSLGYRIAKVAERVGADIIHCHQYSPFVYGSIAALLRPQLKLVFTEHGRLSDGPPSLKRRFVNPLLGRLPGSLHSVRHHSQRRRAGRGADAGRSAERAAQAVDSRRRVRDRDDRPAGSGEEPHFAHRSVRDRPRSVASLDARRRG
ncbi:MAG: hypothetical protein DMG03_05485 [Acidobacteria bacterium]|nr:MAG: hypothetical protein DMG03_05485 [Acidobacteriota bacterium]